MEIAHIQLNKWVTIETTTISSTNDCTQNQSKTCISIKDHRLNRKKIYLNVIILAGLGANSTIERFRD